MNHEKKKMVNKTWAEFCFFETAMKTFNIGLLSSIKDICHMEFHLLQKPIRAGGFTMWSCFIMIKNTWFYTHSVNNSKIHEEFDANSMFSKLKFSEREWWPNTPKQFNTIRCTHHIVQKKFNYRNAGKTSLEVKILEYVSEPTELFSLYTIWNETLGLLG